MLNTCLWLVVLLDAPFLLWAPVITNVSPLSEERPLLPFPYRSHWCSRGVADSFVLKNTLLSSCLWDSVRWTLLSLFLFYHCMILKVHCLTLFKLPYYVLCLKEMLNISSVHYTFTTLSTNGLRFYSHLYIVANTCYCMYRDKCDCAMISYLLLSRYRHMGVIGAVMVVRQIARSDHTLHTNMSSQAATSQGSLLESRRKMVGHRALSWLCSSCFIMTGLW